MKYQTASQLFSALAEWAYLNPEQDMGAFCERLDDADKTALAVCDAMWHELYAPQNFGELIESTMQAQQMSKGEFLEFRIMLYLFLAEAAKDEQDKFFVRPTADVYEAPATVQ